MLGGLSMAEALAKAIHAWEGVIQEAEFRDTQPGS